MEGVGFPPAGHRKRTVLAAGTASSFFSILSGRVQKGTPEKGKAKLNRPISAAEAISWRADAFEEALACAE